jgi:hypothetical protein
MTNPNLDLDNEHLPDWMARLISGLPAPKEDFGRRCRFAARRAYVVSSLKCAAAKVGFLALGFDRYLEGLFALVGTLPANSAEILGVPDKQSWDASGITVRARIGKLLEVQRENLGNMLRIGLAEHLQGAPLLMSVAYRGNPFDVEPSPKELPHILSALESSYTEDHRELLAHIHTALHSVYDAAEHSA